MKGILREDLISHFLARLNSAEKSSKLVNPFSIRKLLSGFGLILLISFLNTETKISTKFIHLTHIILFSVVNLIFLGTPKKPISRRVKNRVDSGQNGSGSN